MIKLTRSICLAALALLGTQSATQATLTYTNSLTLWLKADALSLNNGDPVSLWVDNSTVGNDATQATANHQPTYQTGQFGFNNQLPGVTFDGLGFNGPNLGDRLVLDNYTSVNAVGVTYFAVFKTTSTQDDNHDWAPYNPILSDNTGAIGLTFGVNDSKLLFAAYDASGGDGFIELIGGTTVSDGLQHMASVTDSTTATMNPGTANMYLQGVSDAASQSRTYAGFRAYNSIGFGAFSDDTFEGSIAEILVYEGALSAENRQSVEAYLTAKYFSAVPEPSTVLLLVLGGGLLWRRRR